MGRNWAITVGINQYHNLKPLQYAQRDAEAMQDFCLNEAKFERVYQFAEGAPPIPVERGTPLRSEPTLGSLERFLRVRFEQKFLEAGDNLWFFFAGHGKRHRGKDYLMPIDGDPGNVERTGIAIRDVADRLRRSGADNVVLLLDACRGEDDRDGGAGIGTEQQQGVITLFACSPNELSYEIEALEQGAFTHCLLQGLRIAGENNCATVERLYQHLRYQVPELNRRHNKPLQHPYGIIEPLTKGNLILLPQFATSDDFKTLMLDAQAAELAEDFELAEQLWIRALNTQFNLQAVKAIQRIALHRDNQLTAGKNTSEYSTRIALAMSNQDRLLTIKPLKFEFEVMTVNAQGEVQKRRKAEAEYRIEALHHGIALEMIRIPEGDFLMGSPAYEEGRDLYQKIGVSSKDVEGPQHQVTVPSFWIGKYPVTQAQWQAVAAMPRVKRTLKPEPSNFQGAERPVRQVSWADALEFCARLSQQTGYEYRLPSESEWEYACRARTKTPFYFGQAITTALVNCDGTNPYGSAPKGIYREQTTDVGHFPANAFGLYDMHGNVWEWCLDCWHDSYDSAPNDGSAWLNDSDSQFRLVRGGSWYYSPAYCRSAVRGTVAPDGGTLDTGFRVVCSALGTL